MSTDVEDSLSELAKRLKQAEPLESLSLAKQISEQVEALRAQLADRLRSEESARMLTAQAHVHEDLARVTEAARQIQVDQAALLRFAELARQIQVDQAELVRFAEVARQIQADQAELVRVAAQIRQMQELGAQDQLLKQQQELAALMANYRKTVDG